MTTATKALRDAALAYAERGWPVFPLKPGSKRPLTEHGFYDATTDAATITAWWRKTPNANIGLPTGDQFIAIDEDLYKEGFEHATLDLWKLPPTLINVTASGGQHELFSITEPLPCVSENRLAQGICVKAVGGYIVAPPSVVNGKRYRWLDPDQPITPLPPRMRDLFLASHATAPSQDDPPQWDGTSSSDWGEAQLRKALAISENGTGDITANWLAMQLLIEKKHDATLDVHGLMLRYAHAATVNHADPFTEKDVKRWLNSAGKSWLVANGTRAKRKEQRAEIPGANGGNPPAPDDDDDLLGITLDKVKVEDFDWLWHGYLALGKITMGDGMPDLGKSLVTLDLSARVAMGRNMPDGSPSLDEPASVVIICGEDGLADTVVPRVMAAGASPAALRRVRSINLVPEKLESGEISERLLSLVADLTKLEKTITRMGARLLIIDPITAYLGSQIDMYKDIEIRAVLTPLALMAERCHVAVLLVRHLTKGEAQSALHAGLGGIGFIGVARLGMLFVENPQKEGERLVGRYKGNVGKPPSTLAYHIEQVGEAENMVKVMWDGTREINIKEAFLEGRERPRLIDRARKFIRDELKDGEGAADDIFKRGAERGFSKSTMKRAKKDLPITSRPEERDGEKHWYWTLIPDDE